MSKQFFHRATLRAASNEPGKDEITIEEKFYFSKTKCQKFISEENTLNKAMGNTDYWKYSSIFMEDEPTAAQVASTTNVN